MLRDYQSHIKEHILSFGERHCNIMVQMPTGTGKTHLLASVIYDHLKEEQSQCVWIVAHRRELVEQIEETVARYGISKEDGRVKVMSIQWLSRHWENVREERPSLIVIDEAHHALADTYRELWRRYPEAKKLGMTATPCRMNRRGFTDLFDTLITSDSIADFIRKGWLSAFDYVSIRPDSEDQRLIDGLEKRGTDGDFQVKEMDAVLNRRPSIERLYESVRQYANCKKGIVYAISIDHARNIAWYYKEHGINTVAIDSKTLAKERKRLVEDFKKGKIQVLVNVDVFSEGFDCPDVEFIQMARPTLSLAKYLQQVGRGLRKTDGKNCCVMIDNVGLYRLFGLPTAYRDWQAMFEGRMAGKGYANMARTAYFQTVRMEEAVSTTPQQDDGMETIVTHDKLVDYLNAVDNLYVGITRQDKLKAFKDRASGLYGLKRGEKITAMPQYTEVLGTDVSLAVVRLNNKQVCIVDEQGGITARLGRCSKVKFMKDRILSMTGGNGHETYMDLHNGKTYTSKPKLLYFKNVQLLEVDGFIHSRTKTQYRVKAIRGNRNIFDLGFYLRICDYFSVPRCRQVEEDDARWGHDSVCILAGDYETYYRYCGMLADGSIVVEDTAGKYFLVDEGNGKRYIACENPNTPDGDFNTVIPRLKAEASRRAFMRSEKEKQEEKEKRQERLAGMQQAEPFRSGRKWGLKLGGRIVVPPVYRNILAPVGNYCAVECNPCQWGIIMLDGKVVVEANYSKVEIRDDGTARLTVFPRKEKVVELGT